MPLVLPEGAKLPWFVAPRWFLSGNDLEVDERFEVINRAMRIAHNLSE